MDGCNDRGVPFVDVQSEIGACRPWVNNRMYDAEGNVERYKAKLVARTLRIRLRQGATGANQQSTLHLGTSDCSQSLQLDCKAFGCRIGLFIRYTGKRMILQPPEFAVKGKGKSVGFVNAFTA